MKKITIQMPQAVREIIEVLDKGFVKLVDFDNFWMLKGMLTTYFVCKKDNFCP